MFIFVPLPSYSSHTTETLIFYDGDLIRAEGDHKVYLLSPGKRRWIRNIEVFNSYNFKWEDVRVVGPFVLTVFEFTNLIRQSGEEKVYIINDSGFKRHIPSPQVFTSYGFDWNDVVVVPAIEVESYSESRLIRKEGDTKVYYIENNTRRYIPSPQVFISYGFDWNDVRVVNDTEATFFTEGDIITQTSSTPVSPPAEEEPAPTTEPEKKETPKEETTVEVPSATTTEPVAEVPIPIAEVPVSTPPGGGGTSTPAPSPHTTHIKVTDFAASNITVSSVILTWTATELGGDAGRYNVRYLTTAPAAIGAGAHPGVSPWKEATRVEGEPVPQAAGTVQSMTVSRLSAGTTYYFNIKALSASEDHLSNTVTLTTLSSPDTISPAAITDLAASNITTSSVTLTWTAPGDDGSTGTATTYDVMYSTTNITLTTWRLVTQAIGEPTPGSAGTAQSMTVSGLSPGTTYYFVIRASDEAPNWSDLSNVVSFAPDEIPPSDITDLAASSLTFSSVALTWTAPGDDNNTGTATTYDIRYSTSGITDDNYTSATQATGEPTPQVAGSTGTFTVSGLTGDTIYHFIVITGDEVPNWSNYSNVAAALTGLPDTTAPAAVSNLSASNPTGNAATLSWTAPGDDGTTGTATSYDIRYSTATITDSNWASATQVTGEPTPQVTGTSQSMTVSGLSPETTYYFAIKTSDEVPNESGISNVASRATATCISVASGSQQFSISSGSGQPQLQGIILDPLDFQTGSPQTVDVIARDTNGSPITSISVAFTTDSGTNTIFLPLSSGSTTSGTWSTSWTPTDTHCVIYSATVTAVSGSGTSQAELSFD